MACAVTTSTQPSIVASIVSRRARAACCDSDRSGSNVKSAAVPLSMLSGRRVGALMATPEMIDPPEILRRAWHHRAMFRASETPPLAAE